MANLNDDIDIVAEILAEMGDSQAPSLSPQSSPQKSGPSSIQIARRRHSFLAISPQAPKKQRASIS